MAQLKITIKSSQLPRLKAACIISGTEVKKVVEFQNDLICSVLHKSSEQAYATGYSFGVLTDSEVKTLLK